MSITFQKSGQKNLFIGKPELIFDAKNKFLGQSVTIAANFEEAFTKFRKEKFNKIIIPISIAGLRLHSKISEIIEIWPDSKLILLAEMFEEPLALGIINSFGIPADKCEYHILPQHPEELKAILAGRNLTEQTGIPIAGKDAKIRLLERLVTEDDLTGIKNRRYIREFLSQILAKAQSEDFQVTLLIFDIDNFKSYNDTYGHYVGDEILKQAAMLMKRSCRIQDVLGRIGGDEFAVVFWDCPIARTQTEAERRKTRAQHPKEALSIANRFMRELNSAEFTFLGKEGKGILTISGGLATFPEDGSSPEELFTKADQALLDAKRQGKNRVYIVGQPEE